MQRRPNRIIWISIILLLLIIFNLLCVSNNSSYSQTDNNKTDKSLGTLYLSKSMYLLPLPPGDASENKTELTPGKLAVFSHNIRDRKLTENLKPELNLWLDAHGKAGLILQFEIGFQMWEDNTLIEGRFYKILFNNYTTTGIGIAGLENAKVIYRGYEGEPFDILSGSKNFAAVYFKVNLTINSTTSTSTVDIFCGAWDKISFIQLPYDQTLSAYKHDQDKDNDDNGLPGFDGGILIITLVGLVTLYFVFRYPRNRNKLR